MTQQTSPPRLVMRGISKRFGPTVALQDVNLTVQAGEVHALVGENGAGKSTLMKVLSGALTPDSGTMLLDGRPYRPAGPLAARQAGIAMIYQELSLAPHLSVADNLVLGIEPTTLGVVRRAEVRQRVAVALQQFNHPEITPDVAVGRLSPAAQQLVEVARAMVVGARVLVLDEPTSSLTAADAARLFELIARLREQGLGIVYISHFLEEVKALADRITVLRDGTVAGGGPADSMAIDEMVRLMVGREVSELYPRSPRKPGEVLLQVDGLASGQLLRAATLSLRRGEVLGLAGLVGAGRSELLRAIFGLEPVRAGHLKVGVYAGLASPLRRWQQGVGLLSEDRKNEGLAAGLSIADNLTASNLRGLGPLGLVLPWRQREAAQKWLQELQIKARSVLQPVADLSGGNQQKVALGRLLHHDVDILLLDEPTRGIDVGSKAQIYQLINDLATGARGRPRAVLMVSSYLPELLGVCDRIAVMSRGVLGPARPVAELTEQSIMLEATGQEVVGAEG